VSQPIVTSQSGFTLVETLAAVFALALMMSAGGMMLLSAIRGHEQVSTRTERLENLERMTAHLQSDLAHSVQRFAESERIGTGERSLYGGAFSRNGVVLGLVRNGWSNFDRTEDRGELQAIEYAIIDDALVRRVFENPHRARSTTHFETVLIAGVERLDIAFELADQTSAVWGDAVPDSLELMPDTVNIVLTFETGEQLAQSFLVGGRS